MTLEKDCAPLTPQPTVVGSIRIPSHESVVHCLVALE